MTDPVLLRVPLDHIIIKPQARRHFDAEALQELADSIAGTGLQQPPLCRREGERLVLLDGERRIRACRSLGWQEIPVLVADGELNAAEILTRQLVCNLQREDLNPLEKAEGIYALMEQGSLTAEQAAKTLGMSSAAITRSLALLKLPPILQEHVATGRIPPDAAYQLSRVTDPALQSELAEQVITKWLTRDALATQLKRKTNRRKTPAARRHRITLDLSDNHSVTLSGQGLTLDSAIQCLEQLLTRARRSKSQGLSLATFARTIRDQAKKTKGAS